MAFEKGFLRDPEIELNRYLIFSGVLLALMVSTVLYFLFTFFQEAYRVFPFDAKENLMVLTPQEHNFYSLFYASLASVIGQNFGQRLILQNSRPIRSSKTRISQKLVLNGTEFTLWTTFYWLVKTFSLLGVLYWTFVLHYDISFIEEFAIFLILLPLVWFLNSQLGLYRILRKNTHKWVGYAFVLFLASSIALSQFNIWNQNAVNRKILSETLEYKYHFSIPSAQTFRKPRHGKIIKLSMVRTKGPEAEIQLFVESRYIPLNQVNFSDLKSIIQKANIGGWSGYSILISTDSQIDLKEVLAFEDSLRTLNVFRINYQVTPENSRYPQVYPPFSNLSLEKWLGRPCLSAKRTVDSLKSLGYIAKQIEWPTESFCYYLPEVLDENRILIEMKGDQLFLNNKALNPEVIKQTTKTLFKKYENNMTVLLKPDPQSSFGEYIKVRDLLFQAIIELRKEYALEEFEYVYHYDNQYNYSNMGQNQLIKKKYPLSILELTGWNLELYEFLKSN